jgi:hypothetical protein
MAITEDLDIFLADFGVSCTAGAVTANWDPGHAKPDLERWHGAQH